MIIKTIILFVSLLVLAFLFTEGVTMLYEAGAQAGYEQGLEDGIQMANEALTEEVNDDF